jgi:hypothetical protein
MKDLEYLFYSITKSSNGKPMTVDSFVEAVKSIATLDERIRRLELKKKVLAVK